MPEKPDGEVFSNPLPPTLRDEEIDDDSALHQMTNDDFRKLMMTPRVPHSSGHSSSAPKTSTKTSTSSGRAPDEEDTDDPAQRRRKKKIYYAKLKKQEEERQKELEARYRDRARERRDGVNKDYEETDIISTTADYRAVAPDANAGDNYQERRKQIIQESKYLGGDMEHTHLVKGLDYALLEKVRAEINTKEMEQDEEMEMVVSEKKDTKEEDPEATIQFRTKIGRNIIRTMFRRHLPDRNELFLPGRMAYVVDLEEDFAESDIPTTLIRSKLDCPTLESTTTMTTNDIVINKLTQILSYLRQGQKDKKMKKKDKGKLKDDDKTKFGDEAIYGELGEYAPTVGRAKDKDRKERPGDRRGDRRDRDRQDDRDREKKRSYFEKPVDEEDEQKKPLTDMSAREMVRNINDRFSKGWGAADMDREENLQGDERKETGMEEARMKKIKTKINIDSYAECYPGMMESADAIDDSDDEVDYTKMDQGNKKGPIGRWDFDTQEEYSDYMANKEALPKAAFQYGVKMADGRKTRRTGPKDEKKELDREWQKIQNIISKRKHPGDSGPGGKNPRK